MKQLRQLRKMEDEMTENETELNIYFFITKQYDKMHKDLQKIGITVSFDMGWQKRSGGNIYD